jgi:hypothetical protein
MLDLVDPTIATAREALAYAPRPKILNGLRIGLVENTKKNSEAVLRHLGEILERDYGMKIEVLLHKPQRAPLKDNQLQELRGGIDFVIAGVGD